MSKRVREDEGDVGLPGKRRRLVSSSHPETISTLIPGLLDDVAQSEILAHHFTVQALWRWCRVNTRWRRACNDVVASMLADRTPAEGWHARIEGVPLSQQYTVAAYNEAWLRESDHTYHVKDDPRFFMSSSMFNARFFGTFDAVAISRRCAGRGKYAYMSQAEVMEAWEKNRDEAAALGTRMHENYENYYNGAPYYYGDKEFALFRQFMANNPGYVPMAMERVVVNRFLQLAGTIDALFRKQRLDGSWAIIMVDWKRSKEIKFEGFRGKCGELPATAHMPDSNFSKYTLQQLEYAFMLYKDYGIYVDEMYLVVCHPHQSAPLQIPITRDRDLMNTVIAERLRDKLIRGHMGPPHGHTW